MARVMPTSTISPKMFQHFAVITVVITGMLAMFADGEGREALEATVEKHQARAEADRIEQEKGKSSNSMGRGKGEVAGTFGADEGIPSTPRVRRVKRNPPSGRYQVTALGKVPPTMTREEYEEITALQRESIERNAPTRESVEKLLDESRRRSGAGSTIGEI